MERRRRWLMCSDNILMKTYNVKFVSQAHSIALIFLLLVTFFVIAARFFPIQDKFVSVLVIIVFAIIAYLSWQKFVTGRTEWTIDEDGITMKWIKPFAFNDSKDLTLAWEEIENIRQGPDPQYDTIKIDTISGETFKFYHDNLTTRDDYEEFKKLLYDNFNTKNQLGKK